MTFIDLFLGFPIYLKIIFSMIIIIIVFKILIFFGSLLKKLSGIEELLRLILAETKVNKISFESEQKLISLLIGSISKDKKSGGNLND